MRPNTNQVVQIEGDVELLRRLVMRIVATVVSLSSCYAKSARSYSRVEAVPAGILIEGRSASANSLPMLHRFLTHIVLVPLWVVGLAARPLADEGEFGGAAGKISRALRPRIKACLGQCRPVNRKACCRIRGCASCLGWFANIVRPLPSRPLEGCPQIFVITLQTTLCPQRHERFGVKVYPLFSLSVVLAVIYLVPTPGGDSLFWQKL